MLYLQFVLFINWPVTWSNRVLGRVLHVTPVDKKRLVLCGILSKDWIAKSRIRVDAGVGIQDDPDTTVLVDRSALRMHKS